MIRIIAGKYKGSKIQTPKWSGTRPMTDMHRESLFSVIHHELKDARILDLYAGTGAVSIEAISRGASHSTLVEKNPKTAKLIEKNLKTIGCDSDARVVCSDAVSFVKRNREQFDLIFFTPPYHIFDIEELDSLFSLCHRETTLIAELSSEDKVNTEILSHLAIYDERVYGGTRFLFLIMK